MIISIERIGQDRRESRKRRRPQEYEVEDRFAAAPPEDLRLMPAPQRSCVVSPADPPPLPALPMPMLVVREDGNVNRLYLPLQVEDRSALVIVDSGTPRAWLRHPGEGGEWVEHACLARLGGQSLMLPGRRVPPFEEGGVGMPPVIGTVGNDYLLAGSSVLDLAKGTLTRVPSGSVVPGSERWPALSFDLLKGFIILDAHLDGAMRRLLLDTGAPSSILLRLCGDASDVTRQSTDVHGRSLDVSQGASSLCLPGAAPRPVPLWKMMSFPHLEAVGTAIGQRLDGILGLSSLGHKRIVLDGAASRLLLEP